tara:strand:- start:632 stop:1027 length:396 start_codon:yes stop_codon:yes gene_type:complete
MESGIRLLKLITGETVMADIELDKQKKNATLKQPLIFSILNKADGTVSMVATKWVESLFTTHKIKTYHIVANVEPSASMYQLYQESIEDLESGYYLDSDDADEMIDSDTNWDELTDYMDELGDEDIKNTIH